MSVDKPADVEVLINLDELVKQLREAAESSLRMATEYSVVAAHFRPEFEAAVNGPGRDIEKALKLRPYVVDKEADAKSWRNDARMLTTAASVIEKLKGES